VPISVSTKASHYPITVEEAKEHLRVTDTNSDSYIQDLIAMVTEYVEGVTGRTLITTQYTWKLDTFPCDQYLYVPKPPLQAVSSITYIDTDESTQTWGSTYYTVDSHSIPARLTPAYQETWPITLNVPNAVTITYTAGHSSHLGGVPGGIKHAIKFLVAHYWSNRQEAVTAAALVTSVNTPKASDWLLARYQVPFFEGY
jgi:uncharacterized phiE125 gp8 family phage protein